MKVLVLGSNGQLGQSFKAYKSLSNFNYLFANKNFIDLIKSKNMFKKFDLIRPDIIINVRHTQMLIDRKIIKT